MLVESINQCPHLIVPQLDGTIVQGSREQGCLWVYTRVPGDQLQRLGAVQLNKTHGTQYPSPSGSCSQTGHERGQLCIVSTCRVADLREHLHLVPITSVRFKPSRAGQILSLLCLAWSTEWLPRQESPSTR